MMKLYQKILACTLLSVASFGAGLYFRGRDKEEQATQTTGIEERIVANQNKEDESVQTTGIKGTAKTISSAERSEDLPYTEEEVILLGEWMYDVDSMRFSLSLEQYNHFLKTLEMELPFDHTRQRYGATSNDDDIFLRQSNLVQRRMVPRNGAEFAHLGQVDFDAVTLNDLIAAQYSGEDIIGDDSNNQLTPGAVIGIKTNQGNYAKLRIDGYVPLTRGNRKRGNRRTEYKKYNFRVTLGLYSEVYQNREFF